MTVPVLASGSRKDIYSASDYGNGPILRQDTENCEKVISYSSLTLNGAEKNYSTNEEECLAIVWAIRKLKPYLNIYEWDLDLVSQTMPKLLHGRALKWFISNNNQ